MVLAGHLTSERKIRVRWHGSISSLRLYTYQPCKNASFLILLVIGVMEMSSNSLLSNIVFPFPRVFGICVM